MRCAYWADIIAVLAVAGPACSSKSVEKDSPETLAKLADYERAIRDKDALIRQLSARVDELDEAVVIKMEGPSEDGSPGPIVEITGRGPHARAAAAAPGAPADKDDVAIYEAFVSRVEGSLGGIRKCYEGALKRRSDLGAKSVMLTISVKYFNTGKVARARFSPPITPDFDSCVGAIARTWTLDGLPEAVSFNYRTRLKPRP